MLVCALNCNWLEDLYLSSLGLELGLWLEEGTGARLGHQWPQKGNQGSPFQGKKHSHSFSPWLVPRSLHFKSSTTTEIFLAALQEEFCCSVCDVKDGRSEPIWALNVYSASLFRSFHCFQATPSPKTPVWSASLLAHNWVRNWAHFHCRQLGPEQFPVNFFSCHHSST